MISLAHEERNLVYVRDRLMVQYGIPFEALYRVGRKRFTPVRDQLMYLLRSQPWQPTYPEIAEAMQTSHSTVIMAVRRFEKRLHEVPPQSQRPMYDDGGE